MYLSMCYDKDLFESLDDFFAVLKLLDGCGCAQWHLSHMSRSWTIVYDDLCFTYVIVYYFLNLSCF
jgi:hypothetical protein